MYLTRTMLACFALLAMVTAASAATLWRGTVVVLSRTPTASCAAEYSVGESFMILYRPNLGQAVNEVAHVMGFNGGLVLTSSDADRTLRTGSIVVAGATYARFFQTTNANNPINISPATIVASTPTISMQGVLKNAGILGCNIGFRASLVPVFDGPL
ncbi:MAG: hypothetical protein M9939_20790 [Mesorhizobium sp.]|nr:hypothetical protein [Mesorhizobium sp.]MCO5163573.1 hypothetical protein [Mesorhizobium sp.]